MAWWDADSAGLSGPWGLRWVLRGLTLCIAPRTSEITQTLGIGYRRSEVKHGARGTVRRKQGLVLLLQRPSLCRLEKDGCGDYNTPGLFTFPSADARWGLP